MAADDAPAAEVMAAADAWLLAIADAPRPVLLALGGDFFLGWHPAAGRFRVAPRAMDAPTTLPAYLAMVEEARHVHAGGTSGSDAANQLVALITTTSTRIDA